MNAQQILQEYRERKRAPVRGPMTYAECLAIVEENDRLLAALDVATKALIAGTALAKAVLA